MLKNDYALSIVIPTRNRQYYCSKVARQVLNSTSKRVEIVIQDNSENDSLRSEIEDIKDLRVVYNHERRPLSFVNNFNKALEQANGEYICLIGDDDGILPNIENAVKYARFKNLDALIPGVNSVYFWPSENPIVRGAEKGYLVVSRIKNRFHLVNCNEGIIKLQKKGFQDYQATDIPRLYHGLVHRRMLDEIKANLGAYFGGLTPDIYIAIALGFVCNNVEKVSFPITVSGICPRSGSAASATGKHTGELKDAPHLEGNENYVWDNRIPGIYTVETIWAETALHALSDITGKSFAKDFNLAYLISRLWWKYPQFRKIIDEHGEGYEIGRKKIRRLSIRYGLRHLALRIWRRLKRTPGNFVRIYQIPDIQTAADTTMEVLSKRHCEFTATP